MPGATDQLIVNPSASSVTRSARPPVVGVPSVSCVIAPCRQSTPVLLEPTPSSAQIEMHSRWDDDTQNENDC